MTTIDLIRHGEPEGGSRFRGWLDDPLSDTGWRQMYRAVGESSDWGQIISSPLSRCAAFADDLSGRLGVPCIEDERLRELGFGEWEGRVPAELYQETPDALARFWSDPVAYPPPGGEAMLQFQSRVEAAWTDIQRDHDGGHVLLVAHGGVNRIIIAAVLGMPLSHLFRIDIPYAGVSRVCIEEGLPRLVSHGDKIIGETLC